MEKKEKKLAKKKYATNMLGVIRKLRNAIWSKNYELDLYIIYSRPIIKQ